MTGGKAHHVAQPAAGPGRAGMNWGVDGTGMLLQSPPTIAATVDLASSPDRVMCSPGVPGPVWLHLGTHHPVRASAFLGLRSGSGSGRHAARSKRSMQPMRGPGGSYP